jgi:DNA-binding transcriptional MocR family regulator
MLAIEVETCPEEGVTLGALEKTLDKHPVKACILSTTLSNPLGVTMPDRHRTRLAELLERRQLPLIEDDVYGELRFDASRPKPVAAITQSDRVITCGSFSKTAAPGYRIGWLMTDRYRADVERLKRSLSCSSGLLQQLTLADFLASGDYDRHLNKLRPILKQNYERMTAAVAEYFPAHTRTSAPVGGAVLWLEMPARVDSAELFEDALSNGISLAPGTIFSPADRYRNFLRLSFGHPWSDAIETSMRWLGTRVAQLAAA